MSLSGLIAIFIFNLPRMLHFSDISRGDRELAKQHFWNFYINNRIIVINFFKKNSDLIHSRRLGS
jgi:hypothetical protein